MKIHEQNRVLKDMNNDYKQGIAEIRRYLNSDKFSQDVMVNKDDILMRLCELDNTIVLHEDKAVFLHEIKFN